jgi:succinate dehydrogenase cytochrome b556 subunit
MRYAPRILSLAVKRELKGGASVMFIWLFHRISGVTLVLLIGIKILTSYFLFTKDKKPDWALSLHRHPVLDVLILILFTFHSIYGLRTIAIDLGYRKEKRLFLLSNIVASVISAILIYFYFRMN